MPQKAATRVQREERTGVSHETHPPQNNNRSSGQMQSQQLCYLPSGGKGLACQPDAPSPEGCVYALPRRRFMDAPPTPPPPPPSLPCSPVRAPNMSKGNICCFGLWLGEICACQGVCIKPSVASPPWAVYMCACVCGRRVCESAYPRAFEQAVRGTGHSQPKSRMIKLLISYS